MPVWLEGHPIPPGSTRPDDAPSSAWLQPDCDQVSPQGRPGRGRWALWRAAGIPEPDREIDARGGVQVPVSPGSSRCGWEDLSFAAEGERPGFGTTEAGRPQRSAAGSRSTRREYVLSVESHWRVGNIRFAAEAAIGRWARS